MFKKWLLLLTLCACSASHTMQNAIAANDWREVADLIGEATEGDLPGYIALLVDPNVDLNKKGQENRYLLVCLLRGAMPIDQKLTKAHPEVFATPKFQKSQNNTRVVLKELLKQGRLDRNVRNSDGDMILDLLDGSGMQLRQYSQFLDNLCTTLVTSDQRLWAVVAVVVVCVTWYLWHIYHAENADDAQDMEDEVDKSHVVNEL